MSVERPVKRVKRPRIELGWAELVDLPDLDFFDLHAKIDTGARTSSLHATHIRIKANGGNPRVSFRVRWGKGARSGGSICRSTPTGA